MDIISYILSRAYVKKSLVGVGALKGAPCTIASIVDNLDGTHDITFSWKDNTDVTHTSVLTVKDGETPAFSSVAITGGHRLTFTTQDPAQSVSFNVMDGAKGDTGISVVASNVDENNNLTLTLSNGNVINAGKIKAVTTVDNALSTTSSNPVENKVITNALNNKVDKEMGKGLFSDEEKAKLNNIEDGAQVNVLEKLIINGQEATITDKSIALTLITSAVSNLQNYYLKTETYTKQEVEDLIGSTVGVTIKIVEQLPTEGQSNVIYFLPTETEGVYSQYIYSNNSWILIGSTTVDLSNYYTKAQVDTLLNGKQNVLTIDSFPTPLSNNPVASGGVYTAIAQMQPQFQFANMPTASSTNLGFVYQYTGATGTYTQNMFYRCIYDDALGEYKWEEVIFHATVTVDSAISGTSTNPVQNKVVKEALDTKQDIMQFAVMPSAQDNLGKIVQYTGSTTGTYQNGCFYKAVYDSEHDTYVWTIVRFSADISVDNVLSDVSENPVQNKVITKKFDEYKTAFTGTEEEWDALTSEEQNVYDIMNIINDGDVLNLGIYLEKKTAMPVASEDVANKIYLYTGTTTQNYKKGVVYQCISDGQTPATYSYVALIDFGTASIKNSTDRVLPNSTDLVESRAVYSAINTALSSIYTPRGNITCAELTSALLISDNIGSVYETSDSGTTTALFLQGAGHPIAVGSNIGVINAGQDRILFNLMPNAFDLTSYQKKDLAQAVEGQTTVEGALGALSDNKQAKTLTTSVEDATTVEGALGALSTNKATQAEVNDIVNVLGAKNVLPFPYYAGSGTYNGVTITDNGDGSITLDGTCTGMSFFVFYGGRYSLAPTTFVKKNEDYIATLEVVSGSMAINSGTSKFVFRNYITNATSPFVDIFYEDNVIDTRSVKFTYEPTASYDTSLVWYEFNVGTTFNNWRIRPMIRLASISDDTYEPYAKTNQELTVENQTLTNNVDVLFETSVKNICPPYLGSFSSNGITYIGNSDGTVTANGTCSANVGINIRVYLKARQYKVSGCPSGGSYSTYRIGVTTDSWTLIGTHDHGNGTTITIPSDGYYRINLDVREGYVANNLVFKPMITDVDTPESDYDHYVPYAKTNQQLTEDSVDWDNFSELGAVNMLPNTATTQTINGVTFTVNSDGTVTANGTATANAVLKISDRFTLADYIGRKYVDAKKNEASSSTYSLIITYRDGSGAYVNETYVPTEGFILSTISNATLVEFGVFVKSGQSVSNLTFKPMITVPSYNGDYVPYAKSNKELTEDVSDIAYESLTDYGSSEYTLTEGKMWQTKGVTFLYVAVTCTTVSPIENGNHIQIATIPSKFKKPQFNMYPTICNYRDGSSHIGAQLQVQHNGTIAIRGGEAGARYCGLFSY